MDEALTPAMPDLDMLLDENGWYDLWHTHLDWRGDGNRSWQSRRVYLRSLFCLLEQIEQRVRAWSRPAQVWMVVQEEDASQDAVYLHTPNPSRANYPYPFAGVAWGADLPQWLQGLVDPQRYEVGRCLFEGAVSFWVRARV